MGSVAVTIDRNCSQFASTWQTCPGAPIADPDLAAGHCWRRTSFFRLDGFVDIPYDGGCLQDAAGQPLARIYLFRYGPNAGRWAWFVQVDAAGRPFNGGTGVAETGREAREAVEALSSKLIGELRTSPLWRTWSLRFDLSSLLQVETGFAQTGRELRDAVEALVPLGTRMLRTGGD